MGARLFLSRLRCVLPCGVLRVCSLLLLSVQYRLRPPWSESMMSGRGIEWSIIVIHWTHSKRVGTFLHSIQICAFCLTIGNVFFVNLLPRIFLDLLWSTYLACLSSVSLAVVQHHPFFLTVGGRTDDECAAIIADTTVLNKKYLLLTMRWIC